MNVGLGRPLDVRLGRPLDVRLGRLQDSQIGLLGSSRRLWKETSSRHPRDKYLMAGKSFAQFLDISTKHFIFLKTFDSEFSYIEVQVIDQNSKPLEIEDKINITLVIN